MMTSRSTVSRGLAPLVLSVSLMAAGCAAPVVAFAIVVGKAMVYVAAVKFTVATVDRFLGEKSRDPQAEFVTDPTDPNRGMYKRLRFQKSNAQNQPIGPPVELADVPVYRGADGEWHIEKYYLDQKVNNAVNTTKGR